MNLLVYFILCFFSCTSEGLCLLLNFVHFFRFLTNFICLFFDLYYFVHYTSSFSLWTQQSSNAQRSKIKFTPSILSQHSHRRGVSYRTGNLITMCDVRNQFSWSPSHITFSFRFLPEIYWAYTLHIFKMNIILARSSQQKGSDFGMKRDLFIVYSTTGASQTGRRPKKPATKKFKKQKIIYFNDISFTVLCRGLLKHNDFSQPP